MNEITRAWYNEIQWNSLEYWSPEVDMSSWNVTSGFACISSRRILRRILLEFSSLNDLTFFLYGCQYVTEVKIVRLMSRNISEASYRYWCLWLSSHSAVHIQTCHVTIHVMTAWHENRPATKYSRTSSVSMHNHPLHCLTPSNLTRMKA